MSKWKPTGQKVKDGRGQWLLVCVCTDCGRTANRRADRVDKHCSKCKPEAPDAAERLSYTKHKARGIGRGLDYTLTYSQWKEIARQDCFYCGREPSNWTTTGKGSVHKYSGIDRIDSSLGYVEGNCLPCCLPCNKAKMDMGIQEFLDMCARITRKHGAENE